MSDLSQIEANIFRYLVPWGPLKEDQLLIDWDTAVTRGFEYDDLRDGKAKVKVLAAVPMSIRSFLP